MGIEPYNQSVNRTPKAYRFWFPPLPLRHRPPQRYISKADSKVVKNDT